MRIGQRLGLGFGVILLLMVGMAVFISLSLNRSREIQLLSIVHATNIRTLDALEKSTEQWLMTTEFIIKERNLSQLDYHEILKASVEKGINEIDWSVYEGPVVDSRDTIVQTYHTLAKLNNAVQTYLRFGREMSPELTTMDDAAVKFETDASVITQSLADLSRVIHKLYDEIVADSKKVEARSWLSVFIISPITVIFSIIYAFIITRGITKPLNMLNMATVKIANGLYDVKSNIKSSIEIERLMNAFNDMAVKLSESHNKLERLSITDQLTGLYNRRYFDEALEKEILRARRFNHGLSLLFMDIDYFKHLNDTYGHGEGDKVLQRLGQVLTICVRSGIDVPCRYGGEEFTVILPQTVGADAVALAERIRMDFETVKFQIYSKRETFQKTISIGIAELTSADGAKALIANADKAMYEAKKQGRNRVCKYPDCNIGISNLSKNT